MLVAGKHEAFCYSPKQNTVIFLISSTKLEDESSPLSCSKMQGNIVASSSIQTRSVEHSILPKLAQIPFKHPPLFGATAQRE